MGFLVAGLAFLVGLLVAQRLTEKPRAPSLPAPGAASAHVGYAVGPKAQPGDVVASFPHARWGQVVEVLSGADGGYRYVVGFSNGATVELRGREFTGR